MRRFSSAIVLVAVLLLVWPALQSHAQTAPPANSPTADSIPRDWIDPDTGHRVIRLSDEPGSRTLYFHDNSYTPEGDKLIFNTPSGVACVDITQLGIVPPKMEIGAQG